MTITDAKNDEKSSYRTSNTTTNSNYDPNLPSATATPLNMSTPAPGVATRGNATSGENNRFFCEKCHAVSVEFSYSGKFHLLSRK